MCVLELALDFAVSFLVWFSFKKKWILPVKSAGVYAHFLLFFVDMLLFFGSGYLFCFGFYYLCYP